MQCGCVFGCPSGGRGKEARGLLGGGLYGAAESVAGRSLGRSSRDPVPSSLRMPVEGHVLKATAPPDLPPATCLQEMETTGAAYEDMQAQNGRLLAALIERDETNNTLVAERMKVGKGGWEGIAGVGRGFG